MAAIDTYDAVVLGSGEAGKSIAWHLGGTGKRVAVVEQRYVGGSCPNIACLPSKNIIHGASIAHTAATSEVLGTRVARNVSMREIQARKRTMVEGLIQTHLNKFAARLRTCDGTGLLYCRADHRGRAQRRRNAHAARRPGLPRRRRLRKPPGAARARRSRSTHACRAT